MSRPKMSPQITCTLLRLELPPPGYFSKLYFTLLATSENPTSNRAYFSEFHFHWLAHFSKLSIALLATSETCTYLPLLQVACSLIKLVELNFHFRILALPMATSKAERPNFPFLSLPLFFPLLPVAKHPYFCGPLLQLRPRRERHSGQPHRYFRFLPSFVSSFVFVLVFFVVTFRRPFLSPSFFRSFAPSFLWRFPSILSFPPVLWVSPLHSSRRFLPSSLPPLPR